MMETPKSRERWLKELVKRHNALLNYYYAAKTLIHFEKKENAQGLAKEVLDKLETEYNKACTEVETFIGK